MDPVFLTRKVYVRTPLGILSPKDRLPSTGSGGQDGGQPSLITLGLRERGREDGVVVATDGGLVSNRVLRSVQPLVTVLHVVGT